MTVRSRFVQYETSFGQSVDTGEIVVTPISRVLILTLPFYNLVWNRPVAVIVDQDGSSKKLPIVNVTLLLQVAMLAIGFSAAILTLLVGRSDGKK